MGLQLDWVLRLIPAACVFEVDCTGFVGCVDMLADPQKIILLVAGCPGPPVLNYTSWGGDMFASRMRTLSGFWLRAFFVHSVCLGFRVSYKTAGVNAFAALQVLLVDDASRPEEQKFPERPSFLRGMEWSSV